jgi:hypothetical protein
LAFQAALVAGYTSPSQKIKVLSEHWIGRESYCPSCGHVNMTLYGNNQPVADFFCSACRADFELKSQGRNFGATVADGGYRAMIERLNSNTNPSLLLLRYDPKSLSVVNLIVVPIILFCTGFDRRAAAFVAIGTAGRLDRLQDFTKGHSSGWADIADHGQSGRAQSQSRQAMASNALYQRSTRYCIEGLAAQRHELHRPVGKAGIFVA